MSGIELISIKVESNDNEREVIFWQNNFANEFPMRDIQDKKDFAEVLIGNPHSDCRIETRLVDSKMDGVSTIVNSENVVIATLVLKNGVATGPCTLNDTKGFLYFKGHFKDGYRYGRGQEYDLNGKVIFDGFYDQGKRMKIYPIPEMKGYWKELDDDDDSVISVSKLNNYRNKYGVCYFYNRNEITRVSEWKNGKETPFSGSFELFDVSNRTWFRGHFKDGYRYGRGQEYDLNGKVIFDGFYDQGKRMKIYPIPEMKGYWKELDDDDDSVISVSKLNNYRNKYGVCYFYNRNEITRVSEWKNGKEINVVKQFNGKIMTEYRSGHKRYEGEYLNSLEKNYPRNGHGKEYETDGVSLSFEGWYLNGKRYGEGISYKKRTVHRKTMWIYGHSKGEIFFYLALLAIILTAITIICFYYNTICGVIVLLASIILLVTLYRFLFCNKYIVIKKAKDLNKASSKAETIVVLSSSCNKVSELYLWSFKLLKYLEIGDDCFGSVKTIKIDGLKCLISIKVGNNSFTNKKNGWGNDESKSFHILNCESLESIQIGEFSFSDFAGDFELRNLPQLQSIQIGSVGYNSYNFYFSSFVIRGIELI